MAAKKMPYTRGRSMDFLYVFLRYFFESEYLHFGYWLPGEELKFINLKKAQTRYVEELFRIIPADVKTILDVGCGSGEMSLQLTGKGYRVDSVCPPSILSSYAREKITMESELFECKFEDLLTDKKYDLILFSESFQFIQLDRVFDLCGKFSNKYILISDLFKKDMPEKGPIGGGHSYSEFLNFQEKSKFKISTCNDISEYIAPTFDLEADLIKNFIKPMIRVFDRIISIKNSLIISLGKFTYSKQINRIKKKYLDTEDRNSRSFLKYKTYRFILLEKIQEN